MPRASQESAAGCHQARECYTVNSNSNLQGSKISLPHTDAILARAGSWFLNSGIQDTSGGVARYYLCDSRRNAPVSTEITGYAVSILLYLWERTGEPSFLEAAERSARYLLQDAWNDRSTTFPFEPVLNGGPAYAYFFDCGIIARGLLAMWRGTGNQEYFDRAKDCGLSMAFDFMAEEAMHPILRLPDKQPLLYEPRWSRRPGCYQLKSAVAWHELGIATGQRELSSAFERMLGYSLATHRDFLPGDVNDEKVMDRLHAYCYFLEALLPVYDRPGCASALVGGIDRVAQLLRRIEDRFARGDVYAQLLRVRLFAHQLGICRLDEASAENEAERVAEFQVHEPEDSMLGGFRFGRKQGHWMPFVNPVSTAFAIQALAMWQEYRNGGVQTGILSLV